MKISFSRHIRFFTGKLVKFSLLLLFFISCVPEQMPRKILNGVSFVASREVTTREDLKPVLEVNANAVAVMPFGFMESLNSPNLRFNVERQWTGEKVEGAATTIQLAKQEGLRVMLKPQIWIRRGDFTGNIKMDSEADWKELENNYRDFMILYARLAEREKVEIFCIGTELNSFVTARPEFWNGLIEELRTVYNGELTYAENWDKAREVKFWNALDYIGVDAYFPLSEKPSPTVEELRRDWQPFKNDLRRLSRKHEKPILFTEYGYRNIKYSAKNPWDSSRELNDISNQNQVNALAAIYEEFWWETWFAGGFLGKWHHDHPNAGGSEDSQFTPQNKPAEEVVREYYGKFTVDPEQVEEE